MVDEKLPDGKEAGWSARVVEVCLRFGVPVASPGRPGTVLDRLGLRFVPGTITWVVGPSGAGKSLLLAEIAKAHPTARLVNDVLFPLDVAVVDAVAPTRPVTEALALMTACGLGEPSVWVRRFETLSEGERFRARLARAIGLHRRSGSTAPLLCDEFGSMLHRRLAKAMAFNLRKLVTRERLALVVAGSQEDVGEDLCADQVVRLPEGCVARVAADEAERGVSIARGLTIERGSLRDYAAFAAMHYRQREQVGFVDRVFVMREGDGGEPLGIVVYGHPVLELAARNRASGGRWVRQAQKLNAELRVLKRVVLHPDVRGCGLAHWLVRRTLPMAGTPFVECLAAMGAIHPVFEKAGMLRAGVCRAPASRDRAVEALQECGADPFGGDFVSQVCRRPAVRRIVAASVFEWYRATTGGGDVRVARQSPATLANTFRQLAGSEPVYFIWARDAEGWAALGVESGRREAAAVGASG